MDKKNMYEEKFAWAYNISGRAIRFKYKDTKLNDNYFRAFRSGEPLNTNTKTKTKIQKDTNMKYEMTNLCRPAPNTDLA